MRGARCASIYPDVLGAQMLLRYDVISANCCSILSHPRFGTKVRGVTAGLRLTPTMLLPPPPPKVYPATLFTTAPMETTVAALRSAFPELPALQH